LQRLRHYDAQSRATPEASYSMPALLLSHIWRIIVLLDVSLLLYMRAPSACLKRLIICPPPPRIGAMPLRYVPAARAPSRFAHDARAPPPVIHRSPLVAIFSLPRRRPFTDAFDAIVPLDFRHIAADATPLYYLSIRCQTPDFLLFFRHSFFLPY